MVACILDKRIRKKFLQESKLTLQCCIGICRANERTKQQLQKMDQLEEVNALDKKKAPRDDRRNPKRDPPTDKQPKMKVLWKEAQREKSEMSYMGQDV